MCLFYSILTPASSCLNKAFTKANTHALARFNQIIRLILKFDCPKDMNGYW